MKGVYAFLIGLRISLSLFAYMLLEVSGHLVTVPKTTEAVVGQSVTLNCSTSYHYFVIWEHTPVGTTSYEYVYFSGRMIKPYNLRYRIEGSSSGGEFNLVITDVQLKDSGRYECIDKAGHGERASMELIVLDSAPICHPRPSEVQDVNDCNIQIERVNVTCKVGYSGNMSPSFLCKYNRSGHIIDFDGYTETTTYEVSQHLTLNVDPSSKPSPIAVFCETIISAVSSTVFHVSFSYLLNTSRSSSLTISDSLYIVTCVAYTNIPCKYTWFKRGKHASSLVTESPVLIPSCDGQYQLGADLATFPVDTEALVGSTVQMNCSTSDRYFIIWEHTPIVASSYEYVFFSGKMITPYHLRYTISGNSTKGEYNLVISNVQLSDAGRYDCIDKAGHGERREAQLTVLESRPVCHSAVEEVAGNNDCGVEKQNPEVNCSLAFSGNKPPDVECGIKDKEGEFIAVESARSIWTFKSKILYNFKFTIDPMISKNCSLACRTDASKIESNEFRINVLSLVNSSPIINVTEPGKVNCSVEGIRPCQYWWTFEIQNKSFVFAGQTIFLNQSGKYQCTADCKFFGVQCVVYPLTIDFLRLHLTEDSEAKSSEAHRNLPFLALSAIAIAVPIICIFIYRTKKYPFKKKKQKASGQFQLNLSKISK